MTTGQFIKLVNKHICLSFIPVCLLLSVWRLCCARRSSSCFGAVISIPALSFLFPDRSLLSLSFPLSLPSLFGLQLPLRYERSALTDVRERIQHVIVCPNFPTAVQLCHFLLRISPEMTKWLGRPRHEKAMTECFGF